MNKRTIAVLGAIVAMGLGLTLLILRSGRDDAAAAEGPSEPGALDYPRGPHGARLLSDGPLQLEVTIYETGVPPQFRVYPFDADLTPLSPGDVNLQIELHRLGGRIDPVNFRAEADYLRGDAVVEEPHSFDVQVVAEHEGREHRWSYSQIEGKVELGAEQIASAGITINTAGPRELITTLELPGEVKADETRLAHVVPTLSGVVVSVSKREGDQVRRGEIMAVLNSRELADAKSAYLAATRHVEFTRVALEREEALRTQRISAEQEYLAAKRDFDEADLTRTLTAQKLVVLGVSSDALASIASAPAETMARYEIRAPLDGTVIERDVTVGEAVDADEAIFAVADLSSVWVDVTVHARDLGSVHERQQATVISTDLGDEIPGEISYVGAVVGPDTRTAIARIVLPNVEEKWRPGLFVTVRLVRDATTVPVAVTTEALQTFRDWQVVFVKYGDWFEGRPLELGQSDGQWVEVVSWLSAGEEYASGNSFAVKAEIGKLGATHDH